MDSFSQILLGIATAELVAGKKLQNKTFLYGAILGTIPDLDVVAGKFMSVVDGVAIHRGLSHSLLFFVFLAPLLGFLISKLEKDKIDFKAASWMAFWCLTTHVALDAFTTWGTQILWPLDYRIALKTIFVVDPLYTIPLFIALICVWKNKETIVRKKSLYKGLVISSGYLIMTCLLKLTALYQFEKALEEQNISYQEIIVKPTALNTILWNANVETSEGYLIADYSFLDAQAITFTTYDKNKTLEQKVEHVEDFQKLKSISEGWYLLTEDDQSIYFNDLRFGLLTTSTKNPQFVFSYQFVPDSKGKLIAVEVPKSQRDGKALLKNIFIRLKGN